MIIFVWTPPHFWALAMYRRDDYARSGLPMLPVTHGLKFTQFHVWLYSAGGLSACAKALRPKGVLAVWSASADKQFSDKLRKAGFKAEEVQVFAHGNKGTRHTIWIAEKIKG